MYVPFHGPPAGRTVEEEVGPLPPQGVGCRGRAWWARPWGGMIDDVLTQKTPPAARSYASQKAPQASQRPGLFLATPEQPGEESPTKKVWLTSFFLGSGVQPKKRQWVNPLSPPSHRPLLKFPKQMDIGGVLGCWLPSGWPGNPPPRLSREIMEKTCTTIIFFLKGDQKEKPHGRNKKSKLRDDRTAPGPPGDGPTHEAGGTPMSKGCPLGPRPRRLGAGAHSRSTSTARAAHTAGRDHRAGKGLGGYRGHLKAEWGLDLKRT